MHVCEHVDAPGCCWEAGERRVFGLSCACESGSELLGSSGSELEPAPERTPAEAAALESLVPLEITSVT